jgi:hypothetical protein
MRLFDNRTTQTMPGLPARDATATIKAGNKTSQSPGESASTSNGLESALVAARDLLVGTVEAVNPGTPQRELLGYVTQYRARLADLVAACPAVSSGEGV